MKRKKKRKRRTTTGRKTEKLNNKINKEKDSSNKITTNE